MFGDLYTAAGPGLRAPGLARVSSSHLDNSQHNRKLLGDRPGAVLDVAAPNGLPG